MYGGFFFQLKSCSISSHKVNSAALCFRVYSSRAKFYPYVRSTRGSQSELANGVINPDCVSAKTNLQIMYKFPLCELPLEKTPCLYHIHPNPFLKIVYNKSNWGQCLTDEISNTISFFFGCSFYNVKLTEKTQRIHRRQTHSKVSIWALITITVASLNWICSSPS